MNDKRLFHLSIKYRKKIINHIISKGTVTISNGKYELKKDDKLEEVFVIPSKYHVDEKGIIKLYMSSSQIMRTKKFVKLHFVGYNSSSIVKNILNSSFKLYESNFECSSPFITLDQLTGVLEKFSKDLIWIELPEGYRLPLSYRDYYLDILDRQILEMKERKYPRSTDYCFHYEGSVWIGQGHNPEKYVTQRGIFSYKPIYNEIEWDFDFIRQNKEKINWKSLLENVKLPWTESLIMEFYNYIPFSNKDAEYYYDMFDSKEFINDYSIFGMLSNDFIKEHCSEIEFKNFFRTGIMEWNSDELKYFWLFRYLE